MYTGLSVPWNTDCYIPICCIVIFCFSIFGFSFFLSTQGNDESVETSVDNTQVIHVIIL